MRRSFSLFWLLTFFSSYSSSSEPQWIWATKDAATKADNGSAYFRKAFNLDEPESGTAEVTVDDAFELFLNGRSIGTGDSATKRYKFNLTKRLLPGRNVLAIAAVNGAPGPGGVAATFTVKAKGKEAVTIVTDNTWKFNLKPQGTWTRTESDDSTWPAAFELGEYGKTAPWGKAGELVEGNTGVKILNKPKSREKGLFEFRDGDRVVFLGSGFIERLQSTGYLETMLTAAMPSKYITFRNLGWSGDNVWGDARAVFGSRADGFERLLTDVALCNPSVLIVCYGENEAYAGDAGLAEFRTGLNKLLDSLEATGARIVLLGPRQHEKVPPPLPDPAKYNADLRKYNDVIGQVAKEREQTFLDLYELCTDRDPDEQNRKVNADLYQLTQDGIHLSDYGNEKIAEPLAALLGVNYYERTFQIDANTGAYDAIGATISKADISTKGVVIEATDRGVPFILGEITHKRLHENAASAGTFNVKGLEAGEYEVRVDGEVIGTQVGFKLEYTWYVDEGSRFRFDTLRQLINNKNTLFFHRYRPQNETYLFLFRKHEQGNNAAEIPQFDSLIAEIEKKIAELKKPVKQKYELIKVK